jgi:hypothetical protein
VPIDPIQTSGGFVYAVKFICGTITPRDQNAPVLPGNYETAINVLNPGDRDVEIHKRAIVTLRQGADRGPVGDEQPDTLLSNNGFELDCVDVRQLLQGHQIGPFIKGFVVIRSPAILSVVAVYTSTV